MSNNLESVGFKKKLLSFDNFEMWELRVVDIRLKGSISKERHVGFSFKNTGDDTIHIVHNEYKEESIDLGELACEYYIELEEVRKLVELGKENKYTLPKMSSYESESVDELFEEDDSYKFYKDFIEPLIQLFNSNNSDEYISINNIV